MRWAASFGVVVMAVLLFSWTRATSADHGKKDMEEVSIYSPSTLQWKDGPPSLPKGAKFALLEGNPAKPGPFVIRVKLPAGYRVPPHTHPKRERITVISGTMYIGMGEKFDR